MYEKIKTYNTHRHTQSAVAKGERWKGGKKKTKHGQAK